MIFAEDTKATVAIIVAGIALVGAIFTSAVSLLVSRRSSYLSAVTVERSKWIDKLRSNIARLISLAHTLDVKLYRDEEEFSGSVEYDQLAKDLVETAALIRLQLNPEGKIDANILALITAIQNWVGGQEYKNLERTLVRHVQWLLKEEWEKVKFEARGWWGRLWATYLAGRRQAAYRRFCASDGSVIPWTK